MNNAVAIAIALSILALLAADQMILGWDLHIVLGRRLEDLIAWMAFWR